MFNYFLFLFWRMNGRTDVLVVIGQVVLKSPFAPQPCRTWAVLVVFRLWVERNKKILMYLHLNDIPEHKVKEAKLLNEHSSRG